MPFFMRFLRILLLTTDGVQDIMKKQTVSPTGGLCRRGVLYIRAADEFPERLSPTKKKTCDKAGADWFLPVIGDKAPLGKILTATE